MPQSNENIFKEIQQFFTFYPKLTSPLGGVGGLMKFKNSCLLTLMMLHTKFGKDWTHSSWEDVNWRCMWDDSQWRIPTHSSWSPEWLRWPNYWRIIKSWMSSNANLGDLNKKWHQVLNFFPNFWTSLNLDGSYLVIRHIYQKFDYPKGHVYTQRNKKVSNI